VSGIRGPLAGVNEEGTVFGKSSKPQNRIDSLIGATTRIEGNVFFSGGLRVDGQIRGNVAAMPDQPGTLVISEHARIEGEVRAAHLVVNGTIVGPVDASESLELQANSRVKGDVHYKSVEMQQGAVVEGRLVHHGGSEVRPVELKLASGG
jgi:cytoskeletal protein CcmA (bactofilin family)